MEISLLVCCGKNTIKIAVQASDKNITDLLGVVGYWFGDPGEAPGISKYAIFPAPDPFPQIQKAPVLTEQQFRQVFSMNPSDLFEV